MMFDLGISCHLKKRKKCCQRNKSNIASGYEEEHSGMLPSNLSMANKMEKINVLERILITSERK